MSFTSIQPDISEAGSLLACPGFVMTKEAREWGVSEIANQYTTSCAVVCNALAHRIVGNFIIRVQQPPRPTKMFNNTKDAMRWLGGFLSED